MFPKTRREFLQLSASTAAVAALVRSSSLLWGDALASPRPVKAWLTSDAQKFALINAPKWIAAVSKESESIHIDPTTWYQEILGFGGAFTDASCYLFIN